MNKESEQQSSQKNEEQNNKARVGLVSLSISVLAAAIGVQNKKNLEKDFATTSPFPYIIAGIVFTVLFLGVLIFAAKLALA